jgi:hypothetical protein
MEFRVPWQQTQQAVAEWATRRHRHVTHPRLSCAVLCRSHTRDSKAGAQAATQLLTYAVALQQHGCSSTVQQYRTCCAPACPGLPWTRGCTPSPGPAQLLQAGNDASQHAAAHLMCGCYVAVSSSSLTHRALCLRTVSRLEQRRHCAAGQCSRYHSRTSADGGDEDEHRGEQRVLEAPVSRVQEGARQGDALDALRSYFAAQLIHIAELCECSSMQGALARRATRTVTTAAASRRLADGQAGQQRTGCCSCCCLERDCVLLQRGHKCRRHAVGTNRSLHF